MVNKSTTSNLSKPPWLGKVTGRSVSKEELSKAKKEIEDNPDYSANGWTPETLAVYFKERTQAESNAVLHRRPPKPIRTNSKYNPHKWRRKR